MRSSTLADTLSIINNASIRMHSHVRLPYSKLIVRILDVLLNEGYIEEFKIDSVRNGVIEIVAKLRYYSNKPVITKIKMISKPGCRRYATASELRRGWRCYNGLGIVVVSTPSGVMTSMNAVKDWHGGEVLFSIF